MSRREQVITFRLRIAATTDYDVILCNKFRIGESDICPCDTKPMTVEHILGRCPRLATVRKDLA
jgi:hypothetical protein